MLNVHTTFILGAGSSIPYDFPSGRDLLLEVCEKLNDKDNGFFKLIYYYSSVNEINPIKDFREELLYSNQPSIDAFLEKRPEYLEIGKAAIIASLLPYEKRSILVRDKQIKWYEFLFSKILPKNTEGDFLDKLSILTFNYDRSFEYCFFNSIKDSFGLIEKDTAELMSRIPIIHIYGKLGDLPFFGNNVMDYGFCESKTLEPVDVPRLTGEIKIINEVDSEVAEFKNSQKIIANSVVVTFLGFGYHPLNIKRIMPVVTNHKLSKAIYGTAYNVSKIEMNNIKQIFNRYNEHPIHLGTHNQDIISLLGEQPIIRINNG